MFLEETGSNDKNRLKGKKRFEDNNKNMTSAKVAVFQTGKPPVYKQTIKRWAY
jgi:hypothetical protein